MTAWYTGRPLDTAAQLPPGGKKRSQFRAAWVDTEALLKNELARLGARDVVLEMDVPAEDFRIDGTLRARARAGHRVRLSCSTSKGPLMFTATQFDSWQDNVRGIALTLQSLRAVDRYGVSGSGEQYRGWTAIEAGPAQALQAPDLAGRNLGLIT